MGVKGRLEVWQIALIQTSSYLSAAIYFGQHPVPGKIYATTAVGACMRSAVITYSTIHLKGNDAGKLIGKNHLITKAYWPKVLDEAFNSAEKVAFKVQEQKILALRHNLIAHVNGAELRPIASGSGIGAMKVSIDWSLDEAHLWKNAVEKLNKAVTRIWLSIEVPESEWAPLIAVAGAGTPGPAKPPRTGE